MPEFDGCTAQPLAVEIANLALEDQLRSNLVVTHRKFTLGRQRLGIGNVVRALDASLGAVLAAVRDLLDVVLEEDVQPQGPLAELADVDEPLLEDAVLGVGDAVLVDDACECSSTSLAMAETRSGGVSALTRSWRNLSVAAVPEPTAVGLSEVVMWSSSGPYVAVTGWVPYCWAASAPQVWVVRSAYICYAVRTLVLCAQSQGLSTFEGADRAYPQMKGHSVSENDRDYIQSIERGFAVLTAFDEKNPNPSLADLAAETGLSRPAVRRILLTLQKLGYVTGNNSRWSLTPRVLSIGQHFSASHALTEAALPRLLEIAEHTHESASLGVLDGVDVVYAARVPVRRIMSINVSVGTRVPAYATSMGRAC